MANGLYVFLISDNAVNLYDEIMTEFRARLASTVYFEKQSAREITQESKKAQEEERKLSRIAQVIVDEELDDVSLVPYCPNVLYVRFAFADSMTDVKKKILTIPGVASASSEKRPVVKQRSQEKSAIRPEGTPCLGKKVCVGSCKACV